MGVSPVRPGESSRGFPGTAADFSAEKPVDKSIKASTQKSADVSPGNVLRNFSSGLNPPANLLIKDSGTVSSLVEKFLLSFGLKQDNLNRALFIFSRFFSLDTGQAADPAGLFAELRRGVLNAAAENAALAEGKTGKEPPSKTESRALAAAALAGKGVKLSAEAFEKYAAILDGKDFSGEGERGEGGASFGGNGSGSPNGENPDGKNGSSAYGGGGNSGQKEPGAGELRALFDDFMNTELSGEKGGNGETLRFINSIPGKNGEKWVVWPFKVTVNGTELTVLVRLLIEEPFSSAPCRLFLNIAGPQNAWAFVLEKSGGKTLKAAVSVFPERTPAGLQTLKREAEKFFSALGPVEIKVGNGERFPSMADFLEKEVLLSVNKEV